MSTETSNSAPLKILIIGGTGAQGQHVVARERPFRPSFVLLSNFYLTELVRDRKYLCTILTRDVNSSAAKALEALGNVVLLPGSYEKEQDLRKALQGQYGVYANHNSFSMTEASEYFWTFRLYDIAVQCGVKHFVYSSIFNRPKERMYDENYRAPHMLIKGRISEWLSVQPVSIMPWTIIVGVLYTEQLSAVLRPDVDADGTHIFPGMTGDGHIQFVELAQYGHYARWSFDNPSRSVGKEIALAAYTATLKGIADAFQQVTGKPAISRDLTPDQWFELESTRRGINVDAKMPLRIGGGESDDSRFSFRRYFVAFWNVWKSLTPDVANNLPGLDLADEIYPDRCRSVREWMQRSRYTGEVQLVLKGGEEYWHPQDRIENNVYSSN